MDKRDEMIELLTQIEDIDQFERKLMACLSAPPAPANETPSPSPA